MLRVPWFKDVHYCLRLHWQADGSMQLFVLKTKVLRGSLKVVDSCAFNSITALSDYCGGSPIYLILSGSGSIIKDTNTKDLENGNLLKQLLPTASPDDFAYQVFEHESISGYRVCIARKAKIETALNDLIYLGVVVRKIIFCSPLSPTSNDSPGMPSADTFAPAGIKHVNTVVYQDNIWMMQNELDRHWKYTSIELDGLAIHKREFQYFRFTKLALIAIAPVLLIILIINLLSYQQIEQEYVEYNSNLEVHKAVLDTIMKFEDIIRQRTLVTGNVEGTEHLPFAYYADQVGSTVPENVKLNVLDIYPIIYNQEDGAIKSFRFDTLEISGTAGSGKQLNDWVASLNRLNWVNVISIQNYQQLSIQEDGVFQLIISTK